MLALTCAFSPATGVAANRPGDGDLSPRLAELAKPSVRSAPPAKQAEALSLASEGPGSLLRAGNRVLVEVRFDRGAAAAVEGLRATGAKIVNVSPRYQTVTVAAKPAALPALSGVPRVAGATEVLTPFTAESICPSGLAVSEGEKQLLAGEDPGEARSAFGVDGSGVTVGILSDSFDTATKSANGAQPIATKAAQDVETGDLPGETNTCPGQTSPVDVLDDYEPANAEERAPADEGRGMAQIVHDLAPGAGLAFATAFTGETAFAENIEKLAGPGPEGAEASVIADDVSYPAEPFFQEGPVSVAVGKVTSEGVTYFSAAGNNNLFDAAGNEIGSWEAQQYRDSGSCPPAVASLAGFHGTHCLDFNPGAQTDKTYGIKVAAGATLTVDLQWDEPWLGVNSDFDAFLLNSTGGLIGVAAGNNEISQKPVEVLQWPNKSGAQQTVQLVVNRFAGGAPRLKLALLENGSGVMGVEYPRSTGTDVVGPTIFGHSGATGAISLGAVPFDDGAEAEQYSSRGPVTHYFGPVNGTTAAEPLPSAEVLAKPDIAATDCGMTTFFASLKAGVWRFCGTSAAAPHAAAVAALMSEAKPTAEPAEIKEALLAGAVSVEKSDGCAVGTGMVDAVRAVEDLLSVTPVPPVEPSCPVPAPEGSVEEAREPGNWGIEALPVSPPQPPTIDSPEPPVDTSPPGTSLRKRPAKVVRTTLGNATAVFVFGSDEPGVTFLCRVDQGPWRTCPARFVRRYRVGKHVVRVVARDSAGNSDPSAVVYSFRVKRIG
jgi:Subtilase family